MSLLRQRRYYDVNHLYEHLTKQHYSCDICERQGVQHKYYKNYDDLEHHFRKKHYLCDDIECLAKKFVVFATTDEYRLHMATIHPERGIAYLIGDIKVKGWKKKGKREEVRGRVPYHNGYGNMHPYSSPDCTECS